jgi:quinol monooxygenase YgiN
MQIMTVVTAVVSPEAEADFLAGFRELTAQLPPMLLQTFLLKGDGGEWRIVTQWRSREDLDEYRRAVDTPAAVKLFRDIGAKPVVTLLDVVHHATG